jgi:hypothetical protein
MSRCSMGFKLSPSSVALLALAWLIATPAGAADYVVDSTGDAPLLANRDDFCQTTVSRACTLRAAIQLTNSLAGPDRIFFQIPTSDPNYNPQTGVSTIQLTGERPDLIDSVSIIGPGPNKLIVSYPEAQFARRIFNVTTSGTVSFSGITIAGGVAPYQESGGGIQNLNTATVNVTNCVITNNSTGSGSTAKGGGGIYNASSGVVNVTASTFKGNNARVDGFPVVGYGGAIYNTSGTLTVLDSTFADNHSTYRGGAIFNHTGVTNVTRSTFFDNGALGDGGAIENWSGTLTVANSTFYANIAYSNYGALAHGLGGAIANIEGTLNLTNSTLTANFSGTVGSGVFNETGTVYIKSTLIAQNYGGKSDGAAGPDVWGAFVSQGFNLVGKKDGSTGFTSATDKKGTIASPLNPGFDPKGLRSNGGPTQTVALTATSAALDRGSSAGLTGVLTTDQRGAGFPRRVDKSVANATGGDGTDIGAFELQ